MGASESKPLLSYFNGQTVEILPQRELSSNSARSSLINFHQRRKFTYDSIKQTLNFELATASSTTQNSSVNNTNQLFKVFANYCTTTSTSERSSSLISNNGLEESDQIESITLIPLCLIYPQNHHGDTSGKQQQNSASSSSVVSIPEDYLLNKVTIIPVKDFKMGIEANAPTMTSFKLYNKNNNNGEEFSICVDEKTSKIVSFPKSKMSALDDMEKERPGSSLLLQHFAIRIVPYPLLVEPKVPCANSLFDQQQHFLFSNNNKVVATPHDAKNSNNTNNNTAQSVSNLDDIDFSKFYSGGVSNSRNSNNTFVPSSPTTATLSQTVPPFELTNFAFPDFRVDQEGANTNLGNTSVKMRPLQPMNPRVVKSSLREFKIYVKSPPGGSHHSQSRESSFRKHNNKSSGSAVVVRSSSPTNSNNNGGSKHNSFTKEGGKKSSENSPKAASSSRPSSSSSSPRSPSSSPPSKVNSATSSFTLSRANTNNRMTNNNNNTNNNNPFPIVSVHTSEPVVVTESRSHFDFDNHEGIFALTVPNEDFLLQKMFHQTTSGNNTNSSKKDMSATKSCPIVLNPVKLGSSLQNFRLEPYIASAEDNNSSSGDFITSSSSSSSAAAGYEGYFYLVLNYNPSFSSHQNSPSSSGKNLTTSRQPTSEEDRVLLLEHIGLVLDLDIDDDDENDHHKLHSNYYRSNNSLLSFQSHQNDRILKDAEVVHSKMKNMSVEERKMFKRNGGNEDLLPPISLCLRPKSKLRKHTQLWSFVSRVPFSSSSTKLDESRKRQSTNNNREESRESMTNNKNGEAV